MSAKQILHTTPVCSYCGKEWPAHFGTAEEIPRKIEEKIQQHVQICKKNPLVNKINQLKAKIKDKDQMIEALEGDIVLLQAKLKDKGGE